MYLDRHLLHGMVHRLTHNAIVNTRISENQPEFCKSRLYYLWHTLMIFYDTFSMWLVIDFYTYDSYMDCPPFCKKISFLEYIIHREVNHRGLPGPYLFPIKLWQWVIYIICTRLSKCYFKATPTC